ncbi:MAG TPA: hypothetical protein VJX66_08370 [Amycolatopsis sp.]|nr:hypothetical protein [Amycolatopsis sp.]
MTKTPLHLRRILSALVIALCAAGLAPAVAAAAPTPTPLTVQGHHKHKVKLEAGAEKAQVKAGESTKIKGRLDALEGGLQSLGSSEPIIVQRLDLSTHTWINVASGSCRPNGAFSLSLSFSLRASLSLRVYHPESDLYVSAYSSVFALLVI